MSSPIEIIDIPPEVGSGDERTLAAWKLGFDSGVKATQKQAQEEFDEYRGFESDRVRFRATLLRRACDWVHVAHEAYSGQSDVLDNSITAAARYAELVFNDEADRIRAEWGEGEDD